MKTAFLVAAALLTIGGILPYIRDIRAGKTKPNLISWFTWTLLSGIATAAELSAHEYVAAAYTAAAGFQTLLVILFSLGRGYAKYEAFDVVCQVAALVGVVLWQIFNSPAVGVVATVTVDLIGSLPTIRHAWLRPHEETWSSYALASLGGIFAVAALSTYNWVSLPYALYVASCEALIAGVIITRTKAKRSTIGR
jgi:hypothetical protein